MARSGPLPADGAKRNGVVEVFARCLRETGNYLRDCGLILWPAIACRLSSSGFEALSWTPSAFEEAIRYGASTTRRHPQSG